MTSVYLQNTGGIDPSSPSLLQLPTTIISELVAPPSSTPDVNNALPESTQAATAAATATPSPRPRDSQVPASTTNHIQAARGGDPIGNAGPPDMVAQYLADPLPVVTSTGTVTVTVVPGWTPTKVMLGGSLVAIMVVAVVAMVLLSRRGRPLMVLDGDGAEVIVYADESCALTTDRVRQVIDADATAPLGVSAETIWAARRIARNLERR